ncbi:MAG: PAS domain S-box protein [Bacteroidetes bacterium]|nr:PAS domain S-box protein [Bacteroidota bacterium]
MKKDTKSEFEILRQKAEEALNTSTSLSLRKTHQPINPTETDKLKLIHELEVHQIELEMQNEELILARSAAQEAAAKLTALYDFSPSGYFTFSKKGEIIELNLSGANILGKERTFLKNSRFSHVVSKDTEPIFRLFLEKVFTSRAKETCEVTLSMNVNLPMFVHLTGIATGNGEQCYVTMVDITERKLAEEVLRENNQQIRLITENVRDTIWLMDLGMRTTWISPSIVKTRGYTLAELSGMQMDQHLAPGSLARFIQLSTVHLTPERLADPGIEIIVSVDLEYYRKDGSTFWADTIVTLLRDKEGRPSGFLGVGRDITDRKQAEENLQISEKKYRNLIENAIIGIYTTNLQGKFLFGNTAMCKMLQYDSIDKLLNANVISVYKNKEERKKFIEILKKEKQVFNHELELITTTGKTIDVLINSFISGEEITGMIMDISARRLAEIEILKLNKELDLRVKQRTTELEEANKELETFSYSVSHDLKAPLRHISGFIGLFLDNKSTQLTEEELGYLEVISSSALEMGRLIDAILSFSKLNRSEFRKTTIHSSGMVQQVIKSFEPDIKTRNIKFNVESLPDVQGDEDLIRQVWSNLISNAIKYTGKKPEAIINIGAISTENETTFFIKDNGAGFDIKYAEKLFGVFQRLHNTSDFEGVGIGLANVNRIITRHGGHCNAEAELDKGATFYFSLPK